MNIQVVLMRMMKGNSKAGYLWKWVRATLKKSTKNEFGSSSEILCTSGAGGKFQFWFHFRLCFECRWQQANSIFITLILNGIVSLEELVLL